MPEDNNIAKEPHFANAGNLIEDLRIEKNYDFTDYNLAKLFILNHGKDLKYIPSRKIWATWGGEVWEIVTGSPKAYQLLMRFIEKLSIEGWTKAKELDLKDQVELIKFLRGLKNGNRAEKVLTHASRLPSVQAEMTEFDADPWLMTVKNTTVNLKSGWGTLVKSKDRVDGLTPEFTFKRRHLITKRADVLWNKNSECPKWLDHLDLVFGGDQELIDYMQVLWGYFLIGITDETIMPFAFGDGANGKSVCWNTIHGIMGTYSGMASADLLMPTDKPDEHRQANLFGKRAIFVGEPEDGRKIAAGKVKELTGDESITARRLYENAFEFKPTHTFFCSTNHKPRITTTDHGIWRRIKLIPFTVNIPEALKAKGREPNNKIIDDLKAEWPGIFAWLVRGAKKYKNEGLVEPKAVTDATLDYRHEEDSFKEFIDECLSLAPANQIPLADAWKLFKDMGNRMQRKTFKAKMQEVPGVTYERAKDGWFRDKMVFNGIGQPKDDDGDRKWASEE